MCLQAYVHKYSLFTVTILIHNKQKIFSLLRFICISPMNSVSGQVRPRSACANAQADLGLGCPFRA